MIIDNLDYKEDNGHKDEGSKYTEPDEAAEAVENAEESNLACCFALNHHYAVVENFFGITDSQISNQWQGES